MIKMTMIRHGKTPGNLQGRYVGRTDEGILEEERGRLSAYQMGFTDEVFISPMRRCRETADIIYPIHHKIVIPEFKEIDFGNFEYKTYQELSGNPDYQAWIDSGGTTTFPEGESLQHFHSRIQFGMEVVLRECLRRDFHNVGMVVHGGTIMSILSRFAKPKKKYFDWQVRNGEGFVVRINPEAFFAGERKIVVDEKVFPNVRHKIMD